MTKETDNKIKSLQLELKQVSRGYSILNENQVQKLFNTTSRKWTYDRPAKGGGNWRYVKRGYVRRTLDSVFGFNWDFIPETSTTEAFEVAKLTGSVIIKGTLTCRILDPRGQPVATLQKGDYGRADVKFKKDLDDLGQKIPLDFGNDLKAATTDCFKRCAMWLGVAADVYDPEEFMQIEIVGSEENSDSNKNRERMIKEAKKSIKTPGKEVKNER
jgi:hypothetical protein